MKHKEYDIKLVIYLFRYKKLEFEYVNHVATQQNRNSILKI